VMVAPWPQPEAAALEQDEVEYVVQVNGVKRGTVRVPKTADKTALELIVKSLDFVKKHIEEKIIKRVVVVPGRLINIVV
jgi:leucyl-tRNA synthetase